MHNLQTPTYKLSEMNMRPVCSPGTSESINIDLIPNIEVQQDALTHHVVPLVLSILVYDACHVNTISSQ